MMEAITTRSFPAKILLFGEYSVIHGGSALAIPFSKYSGKWVLHQRDNNSLPYVQGVKKYLLNAYYKGDIEGINFDLWERAIGNNLHFESNIPKGSGLGSSGAVTAAIYDAFVDVQEEIPLADLKTQMAFIESFFHGKSSGIDPMVSYLNEGVLITKKDVISCDISKKISHSHIGLIDSEMKRQTGPLVQKYLEMLKDDGFKESMENLSSEVEAAIGSYLKDDINQISNHWKKISDLQLDLMDKMIPEKIRTIWKQGLVSNEYYLKLCGAGGGGYFLFWSMDQDKLLNHFPDWKTLAIN